MTAAAATISIAPPGELKPGNASFLECAVVDEAGTRVDPTTVTGEVHRPDGTIDALTVAKQTNGLYAATYAWAVVGPHVVRFVGTGASYPFVSELPVIIDPLLF